MDSDRRTFLKILAGAGITTALGVPDSASADVGPSTRLPESVRRPGGHYRLHRVPPLRVGMQGMEQVAQPKVSERIRERSRAYSRGSGARTPTRSQW